MSSSSASPDPITLPSSPLAARSDRVRRKKSARSPAPIRSYARHSPVKTSAIDVTTLGEQCPWDIRVTVEAEPRDGSSPKRRKLRSIQLPVVIAEDETRPHIDDTNLIIETVDPRRDATATSQPLRKRMGTPIRRSRSTQIGWATLPTRDMEMTADAASNQPSPLKKPPQMRSSSGMPQAQTMRSQRLSRARDELDRALDSAVGEPDPNDETAFDVATGEMTFANEDFTMVSPQTLETLKNNTSLVEEQSTVPFGKDITLISNLPSSPPKAHPQRQAQAQAVSLENGDSSFGYPEIAAQAQAIHENPMAENTYDAMSWKPTGLAKEAPIDLRADQPLHIQPPAEPTEREHKHDAVISNQINDSQTREMVFMENETHIVLNSAADEDIWAEEASRSLQESHHHDNQALPTEIHEQPPTLCINQLFSGQPVKPPRPKIPSTWRRVSGMDFSYSDSPEHGTTFVRRTPAHLKQDERRFNKSNGVATPPSSERELAQTMHENTETQPPVTTPASAILKASGEQNSVNSQPESSDHNTTNEPEIVWRLDMAKLRQQQQTHLTPRASELSEILAAGATSPNEGRGSSQPEIGHSKPECAFDAINANSRVQPAVFSKPVEVKHTSNPAQAPTRRGVSKRKHADTQAAEQATDGIVRKHARMQRNDKHVTTAHLSTMSSGLRHEREISSSLAPTKARRRALHTATQSAHDNQTYAVDTSPESASSEYEHHIIDPSEDDYSYLDETPSRSYEERLNLDSPQKVQVDFNDSLGNSSLLAPKRKYPNLFDSPRLEPQPSSVANSLPPSTTMLDKLYAVLPQSRAISRWSSNLLSAMIRPTGPTFVAGNTMRPNKVDPEYSLPLRAQIRSRYGVLGDTHPWTMTHMRTLHRMVNSCTSNKSDSIIPTHGPLPRLLHSLIDTRQTAVTGFTWTFTEQDAQVVFAFMQTLVSRRFVEAMDKGEVDFLGDHEAKRYRTFMGGRHGRDLVWRREEMLVCPEDGSAITMEFAARALGNVVSANAQTAARLPAMEGAHDGM